jgi:hypothetical protein
LATFWYYFPDLAHFLFVSKGSARFRRGPVFEPAGRLADDLTPFVDRKGTVWLTGRWGQEDSEELWAEVPLFMTERAFGHQPVQQAFSTRESWYRIKVVGVPLGARFRED